MEAHEIELVKRLQAGDQQAFDELYQQYYQRAVALAYRFTKDYADAEDIRYRISYRKALSKYINQSIHFRSLPISIAG